jgi:hypothetical protein
MRGVVGHQISVLGRHATLRDMSDERTVSCGNRTYVIKRFEDHLIALCDEGGKVVAGWPLTAFWPDVDLTEKTDEEWCAMIAEIRRAK